MTTIYNADTITELEAHFIARNDLLNRLGNLFSTYLTLPGSRGLWTMAQYNSAGQAVGQATGLGLTYNGNPVYDYDNLVPYIRFDGVGDYLAQADNAEIRITGSEAFTGNPGLTIIGWFNPDNTNGSQSLIGKWTGYLVQINTANTVRFVTYDGTTVDATGEVAIVAGEWNFVAARFIPSTSIQIWSYNKTSGENTDVNTTSIPAALSHSAVELAVGRLSGGGQSYTGKASMVGLYASALSDAQIFSVYQQGRVLYRIS